MSRFYTSNSRTLEAAMKGYLDTFLGDIICARQIWYECLGGYGTPTQEDMKAMQSVLDRLDDWQSIGTVRYEKFGLESSYKRKADNQPKSIGGSVLPQHICRVNELYKTPDGKTYKIVLSEVYNIRCFEVVEGKMTGPMIKFHPESDIAKSLVAVSK